MRWFGCFVVLMLALTAVPGCRHAPPTLTPQAQAAFTLDQVVMRLGEFQQAVIDLSDAGKLDVGVARNLVQQIVVVLEAVKGPPTNWRLVITQFWVVERPIVRAQPALVQWVGLIDGLVGGL